MPPKQTSESGVRKFELEGRLIEEIYDTKWFPALRTNDCDVAKARGDLFIGMSCVVSFPSKAFAAMGDIVCLHAHAKDLTCIGENVAG